MRVLTNSAEIYSQIAFARREERSVGLVPTMGALHDGHLSLVAASKEIADLTVATIFINPTQFGQGEDFSRYPRTLEEDLAKLRDAGVDFVFAPETTEIYRANHGTWVEPAALASQLEGEFRPGHYRGVATIVLKLFQIIPASVAFFGKKDYQQWLVIQKMVDDLNVPIRIVGCPTVRESGGLAMSSRNRYLSQEDREKALSIHRALAFVQRLFSEGERSVAKLEQSMLGELRLGDMAQVDYARVVDADSLATIDDVKANSVALIAARVGSTRLIDNQELRFD
jgi:pantoate--beta-alanine ligase